MATQTATTMTFTPAAARTCAGGGRPGARSEGAGDRRRKELAAARAALLRGPSHPESALRIALSRAVRDAHATDDLRGGSGLISPSELLGAGKGGVSRVMAADDAGANAVNTSEVWTWSTRED